MPRLFHKVPVSLLLAAAFLCGPASAATAAGMNIFASIPPHAFLAREVGGDHVTVHTLLDNSQNPHTFEPSPRQLLQLRRSKILLTTGLPFEKKLLSMMGDNLNNIDVVATDFNISKRQLEEADVGNHADTEDPHIWLSPLLLKTQAETICRAFIKRDPDNREAYQRNLSRLLKGIDRLHWRLKKTLSPYMGRTFYVFHPAFGYFADTYGLVQKAVELEGKDPSPKQLAAFIKQARADRITTIFAQPQFDPKSAMAVAEAISGELVMLDSMAENIFRNLQETAEKIADSFASSSHPGK